MEQEHIKYEIQTEKIDEDFFEQCVVEHMSEQVQGMSDTSAFENIA